MVKAFWLLKRRPGMSPDDFHRYWREHHGPLFCSTAPTAICHLVPAEPRHTRESRPERRRL